MALWNLYTLRALFPGIPLQAAYLLVLSFFFNFVCREFGKFIWQLALSLALFPEVPEVTNTEFRILFVKVLQETDSKHIKRDRGRKLLWKISSCYYTGWETLLSLSASWRPGRKFQSMPQELGRWKVYVPFGVPWPGDGSTEGGSPSPNRKSEITLLIFILLWLPVDWLVLTHTYVEVKACHLAFQMVILSRNILTDSEIFYQIQWASLSLITLIHTIVSSQYMGQVSRLLWISTQYYSLMTTSP